jgi:hypothetical protein
MPKITICLFSALILLSTETAHGLKEEEREVVRQQISTVKTWQMTEELDLTEEQAQSLFPAQKSYEDRKTELTKQRETVEAELDELLKAKEQNRDLIKGKMVRLKEIDEQSRGNEDQFHNKLSEILTVEQQAKYELFEKKFDARLREMIRDIQKEDLQKKERSESDRRERPESDRREPPESERAQPAPQRRDSSQKEQTDQRRSEKIERRDDRDRDTTRRQESSKSRDSSRSRTSDEEEPSEKKSSRKKETSETQSSRERETSKERSSRTRNH